LADELQDREVLERMVLRYLLDHPTAADSIEGVRLWWLRDTETVSQPVLQIVLNGLLEREWLVTHGDRPETQIYRLNEREREAVERFIAETGERLDG
jgi:DNA-binding PadR family transcriptional regulator